MSPSLRTFSSGQPHAFAIASIERYQRSWKSAPTQSLSSPQVSGASVQPSHSAAAHGNGSTVTNPSARKSRESWKSGGTSPSFGRSPPRRGSTHGSASP